MEGAWLWTMNLHVASQGTERGGSIVHLPLGARNVRGLIVPVLSPMGVGTVVATLVFQVTVLKISSFFSLL
jgi:uncharacterized protein (DUF2062 family)